MVEEKTSKKKQLILAGIGLVFLLVLVIGATYAYFTFTSQNDFKDPATIEGSMGELGAGVSLTRVEDSTLTLNLSAADMLVENAQTYYASGSETPKTIATVKVAGGGIFNCTYTLEVTKTSTSTETDMYERFQSTEYTNKGEGQIWFTVNDTTYDFNTAELFDKNGKLTYTGTLSMITSEEDIDLTANMVIVNSETLDQTYLNGTDVSISINATEFNCELDKYTNNLSERIVAMSGNGEIANTVFNIYDYTNASIVTNATYEVFSGDYEATSGVDASEIFSYNNGIWTTVPENVENSEDTDLYYHLKITIPEDGYYQLCYSIPIRSADWDADIEIYKNNILDNDFWLKPENYLQNDCYDLLGFNSGEYIQLFLWLDYYSKTNILPMSFYLEKGNERDEINPGHRYQGPTPNNYVTFNGETWRIIGAVDGRELGLTESNYYTKIIRDEEFSNIQYDAEDATYASGNPDWPSSDLYNTLNGDYYNRVNDYAETGLTEVSKELIVDANWYYTSQSTANQTTSEFYVNERSDETKVVKSAVGIMNPSDYGYAAPTEECGNTILNNYGYGCHQKDWLYNGKTQWTMVPGSTPYVYTVYKNGHLISYNKRAVFTARPTVYLDTDVIITGGNGSESSPYQIAKATN